MQRICWFLIGLLLLTVTQVVAQEENRPTQAIIILDLSVALRPMLPEMQTMARRAVDVLPPDAQISVLTFNDFEIATGFGDKQMADDRINAISTDEMQGGSCLYDAAYEGIRLLSQRVTTQRVAVIISNGQDRRRDEDAACSGHTLTDVLTLAQWESAPTALSTVGIGDVDMTFYTLATGSGGFVIDSEAAWPQQLIEPIVTLPAPTEDVPPTQLIETLVVTETVSADPTETPFVATEIPSVVSDEEPTIAAPVVEQTATPVNTEPVRITLPANWYFIFPILAVMLAIAGGVIWWRGRTTTQLPPPPSPQTTHRPQTQIIPPHALTLHDALELNRALAELIVIETPAIMERNRPIPITRLPFIVGRVNCDLNINEPHVSREHIEIGQQDGRFYVIDLDSRNRTFVDGEPIISGELISLDSDTMIGLGNRTLLRFLFVN